MSSSDSTAIIFNGSGLPFEEIKFPLIKNLGEGEVLVRISLSTVCGSDLHTWKNIFWRFWRNWKEETDDQNVDKR